MKRLFQPGAQWAGFVPQSLQLCQKSLFHFAPKWNILATRYPFPVWFLNPKDAFWVVYFPSGLLGDTDV
jgi:hypothetical protein